MQPNTTLTGDNPKVKEWIGLLYSNGTSAPDVIVIKNTLGEELTMVRNSAGDYSLTNTKEIFKIDKTQVWIQDHTADYQIKTTAYYTGVDEVRILTQSANVPIDGALSDTNLRIVVYE